MDTLLHLVHATWEVTAELGPWLLLGAAIAGAMHVMLPAGFASRRFRGLGGIFTAVGIGVPLPLCSCGVIPAGIGLKHDGASNGASVGFLVATPQTGVDSALVSASFLGWPFALFKVLAALVLGVVGGIATDAVSESAPIAPAEHPGDGNIIEAKLPPAWRRAFDHALETLSSIWRWLAFGILVSAALTTFVPAGELADLGTGPWAYLGALVISLPLYVCATASVPIAAALVTAGLPTGAALIFLMAGPATNVATLGAVNRTFGGRVLGVYLATLVVGSIGAALLFDSLGLGLAATSHLAHVHEVGLLGAVGGGALLLILGYFAFEELRAWSRQRARLSTSAAQADEEDLPELRVPVEGITCGGCVRKLQGRLAETEGILDVEVVKDEDAPKGIAIVRGHIDLDSIHEKIREAGYSPIL